MSEKYSVHDYTVEQILNFILIINLIYFVSISFIFNSFYF